MIKRHCDFARRVFVDLAERSVMNFHSGNVSPDVNLKL